ncbi:class I SAM-dependent methyltransferase [Saccharibacillus sp. CPCC 101409]|uniref:class I SAM-dependent methyltransferase n=1 Tax=Saccharibacillus sp. CPCC 101409 TaxID=3058041 RepID=UPI0026735356|nr:class I SAM-dependent methyltransferase [Saccharibacillus sp. CPCC 101409]MDO3411246.1 class I SAM-dependent methyltransferase [Saccharibacillus sp. CPCC 101409]
MSTDYHWNSRIEYLKESRGSMWNDDYLEFLVERVWKIDRPVSVVDYGCGLGFMGAILLPILPEGSTYTGIDKGGGLIEEARSLFEDSPWEATFIQADLEDYEPRADYDLAVCQCVLQHIPHAGIILDKMKRSVVPGGRVVCIELSRDVGNAAIYLDGLDYAGLNVLGAAQKLRSRDLERSGKDFCIGVKMPVYMQQAGLEQIGARMNDRVTFVNPHGEQEEYRRNLNSFLADYSTVMEMTEDRRSDVVRHLVERGLSEEEAVIVFECERSMAEYLREHQDKISIVDAGCLFISYGIRPAL